MNVEVNKAHSYASIEGLLQKPRFSETVEFVGTYARMLGIYANREAYPVAIPPVGGLPPPADNLNDPVEALPPDEGIWQQVLVQVDLDRLIDELCHGEGSKGGNQDDNRTGVLLSSGLCQRNWGILLARVSLNKDTQFIEMYDRH